jgi:hypothetical protein
MFAIKLRTSRALGHPFDLLIDDGSCWVILPSDGYLVRLTGDPA